MAKAKQTQTMSEKLNYIQTTLNAPKNLYNSFGKYKYRNLEGILEGLKPLLKETGCTITLSDEIVCVNEMNYIKSTATLYNGEKSIYVNGWARESVSKKGMDDSQITGSCSSYSRKYACNGLFAIDDTKDADSMDNRDHKTKPKKSIPTTKPKAEEALTDAQKVNILTLIKNVEKGYGATVTRSLNDGKIHQGNYKNCIKALTDKAQTRKQSGL
jgi:hypothetical protein